jgi:hypothetical protein
MRFAVSGSEWNGRGDGLQSALVIIDQHHNNIMFSVTLEHKLRETPFEKRIRTVI